MKTKLPLHHASRLANRIVELLAPHCERIDVAGSIRRECEQVGDIEIVAQPHTIAADMFGNKRVPVLEFMQALALFRHQAGNIQSGEARYLKYAVPTGWAECPEIQLDLFLPQPHDYYRQLAIRTGSANYAKNWLAWNWVRLGWVGTADGLRRTDECEKRGDRWVCVGRNPTLPPVWRNEWEFFEFLELSYISPQNRI